VTPLGTGPGVGTVAPGTVAPTGDSATDRRRALRRAGSPVQSRERAPAGTVAAQPPEGTRVPGPDRWGCHDRPVSDEHGFWSSTDFPYTCLRDRQRTATLAEVVTATVRPGDVVLDAGAGTGILALYAARAGASRVHAVENDPVLCRHLRTTVERNGYAGVIDVVQADVHTFAAPPVDVALVELVETALVDEALVSAYNALLGLGTVTAGTRCLPTGYTTSVQPVVTDDRYDGFEVVAVRHDWPFYAGQPEVWGRWPWTPAGPVTPVWTGTFTGERVEPRVDVVVAVDDPDPRVNGLRVTGEMAMPDGRVCGEFASLNGPKVLPLPPRPAGASAVRLAYTMAESLAGLEAAWV
jgi:hypothetical protein